MKPAEMRKLLALLAKYREFLDSRYMLTATTEWCLRVEDSVEYHLDSKKVGK